MATLTELRKELAGKQANLSTLFKSKPDYDFSDDEVSQIQQAEKELNDLYDGVKKMETLEGIKSRNEDALAKSNIAQRNVAFPSDGKGATQKADGSFEAVNVKTLGEQFTDSDAFTQYRRELKRGPISELNLKSVFATTTTGGAGAVGYDPQTIRTGLVVTYLLRQPIMDSIVPTARTNQVAVVYMEEQAPVNGSGWVTENDNRKRESSMSYIERSVPVRKVRTTLPVTDEMLADIQGVQDLINTRLMTLFALEKDRAILSGSGTAPEITGLLNIGGIQTQAKGADPAPDAFHKALTKIAVNSFLDADHIIMHPNNWQDIRLLRTVDGVYIFGSPMEVAPARMWGMPVTVSQAITQGTALVGAFQAATQQYTRQDVSMLVSSENEDNFMRGVLTIKLEMRMALVCYRPTALCTVTGL